jgi:hypothetical protein
VVESCLKLIYQLDKHYQRLPLLIKLKSNVW